MALKTDHMLLLKAGVVGAVQETAHMSLTDMEKVFNLALPMKSISGAIIFKEIIYYEIIQKIKIIPYLTLEMNIY